MNFLLDEGQPDGKKILLLHGVGGTEHTLMDTARFLDEKSTVLSFRGAVKEDGMNRFYRRGGLDLEAETDCLLEEITRQSERLGIPLEEWVFVGYSNGANIAAHLLLKRKTAIRFAVLLHPAALGATAEDFTLADKLVWLSYGTDDPIVPEASFNQLAEDFEGRQANVTLASFDDGHQVTMDELESARDWLAQLR